MTDGGHTPDPGDPRPREDPPGHPLGSRAQEARSAAARVLFNRRVVRTVGVVVVLGLVYYAFFVVLPGEISWAQIWADLTALTWWELLALVAAGLGIILALGWTSKASLPGLTLYQGTESSATSQLTAFVVPPPGDLVVRFAMYRTYGFSDEQSASAVLIAMVARYVAIAFLPILGLAMVLVTGQGHGEELWWFLGLGLAFAIILGLLLWAVRSNRIARSLARVVQRVFAAGMRVIRRTPPADLDDSVVRFVERLRGTLGVNGKPLLAANLTWLACNVALMFLAMRFAGLTSSEVSGAEVVLATGSAMVINLLPVPGKNAFALSFFVGLLSLTTSVESADLGTAILLYRVMTWLLPMPVGAAFFFLWRRHVRHSADWPPSLKDPT